MKEDNKKEIKNEDVIEIPIGKLFGLSKLRQNPWILSTLVLAIVLIVLLATGFSIGSGNVKGDKAADNLINFINAQGNGDAKLVSLKEDKGFYEITVEYQGTEIPVLTTLDGNFLVTDIVPINGEAVSDDTAQQEIPNEKIEVTAGNSPSDGSENAQVTIIEFSDYECPFCERFYSETLPQIKEKYIKTGKVKLVFKDFPLSFHPSAQKAAEAARCARAQRGDTGYWKMHDKLFENQASLSIENYKKWAKEIGLNAGVFDACIDSDRYADDVKRDLSYGESLGITGTPGFFINGISLSGAQPFSAFEQIIEQELAE